MDGMWLGVAEYADGTRIEVKRPYNEGGLYAAEEEKRYEIESFLVERREGCTYYSVVYVNDDAED